MTQLTIDLGALVKRAMDEPLVKQIGLDKTKLREILERQANDITNGIQKKFDADPQAYADIKGILNENPFIGMTYSENKAIGSTLTVTQDADGRADPIVLPRFAPILLTGLISIEELNRLRSQRKNFEPTSLYMMDYVGIDPTYLSELKDRGISQERLEEELSLRLSLEPLDEHGLAKADYRIIQAYCVDKKLEPGKFNFTEHGRKQLLLRDK